MDLSIFNDFIIVQLSADACLTTMWILWTVGVESATCLPVWEIK